MVVWLLNLVSSWVRHSGLDFDGIRSGFCLIILCKVIVSVFELWLILGSLFFFVLRSAVHFFLASQLINFKS